MKKILTILLPLILLLSFTSDLNAQDCYDSSIVSPTPFRGMNGEVFRLSDGSIWEVKYKSEYMDEYRPSVIVCPKRSQILVESYYKQKWFNVELITDSKGNSSQTWDWEIFEETSISGKIIGTVTTGDIFKTTSGNSYEITEGMIDFVVEVFPDVIVLKKGDIYNLAVEGFDEPVLCKRVKF